MGERCAAVVRCGIVSRTSASALPYCRIPVEKLVQAQLMPVPPHTPHPNTTVLHVLINHECNPPPQHNRYFMEGVCDRLLELDGGKAYVHNFGGVNSYGM